MMKLITPFHATSQGRDSFPTPRASSQRDQILALLRARGAQGISNLELYATVCLRPPSRIFELRALGNKILTVPEGGGVYRYVLVENPGQVSQPQASTDWEDYEDSLRAKGAPLFAKVKP